jgi:CRP-like cAMP-binding protein
VQPADYFRRIPLFSDLGPEEIVDVLRIARVVSFEPGALLCARGEKGDCAFVIEDGEAAVRVVDELGKPVVIARVGPGEVVGELSLVDGHPRSADVVATRALRGYRIDRVELDALRRAMHPAAFKILRRIAITVSDRLRDVNDAIGQALTSAPAAVAKGGRASDPDRGSRAGARASRELGRASLPQAAPARPSPGPAGGAKPARAARPAAAQPAKAKTSPKLAAPSAASPAPAAPSGGGSLWGSMLSKLRGSSWK